jgi:hypothetical protein
LASSPPYDDPSNARDRYALIKNSALVSAIGVEELFYRATVLGGETLHHFEFMTVTAAIYFYLIVPLSALVQRQERRMLAWESRAVAETDHSRNQTRPPAQSGLPGLFRERGR